MKSVSCALLIIHYSLKRTTLIPTTRLYDKDWNGTGSETETFKKFETVTDTGTFIHKK